MMRKNIALLVALLTLATGASAATFNLFAPAAGILKGNPSTYVTTAAVASDVIATFSGTCNSSTFLRADGSCQAAATTPGGSTTQLQYNNGGAFAGIPQLTWASGPQNLTFNGSGVFIIERSVNPPLIQMNSLTTGEPSTIQLNNTTNGLFATICLQGTAGDCYANGTPGDFSIVPATGHNIGLGGPLAVGGSDSLILSTGGSSRLSIGSTGAWTVGGGVGTNGQVLTSGGAGVAPAWTTVSGGGSGANPTATIGLTAVNGAAGTFTRSDGAAALSQAIAPTWTATHIFSKVASTGLDGAAMFSSAAPLISWFETDGSTNNKVWSAIANSEQLILQTRLDDGTGAVPIMTVDRTGTTVDTIAFGSNVSSTKASGFNVFTVANSDAGAGAGSAWYLQNSSSNYFRGLYSNSANVTQYLTNGPTGAAAYFYTTASEPISIGTAGTERMRIDGSGNISVSGQFTSTKTGSTLASAAVVLNATTNPSIVMNQSGAAANNRQWERVIDSEQLIERVVNDANNAVANWLVVDRTANTVDTIAFAATNVTINGSAVPTETSGSQSMTLSAGCTTNPSQTFTWRKIGTVVTLRVPGGISCTTDGVNSLQFGTLPAGIRPTNQQSVLAATVCGGVGRVDMMNVGSSGTVVYTTTLGSGGSCASGTFNNLAINITYSTAL